MPSRKPNLPLRARRALVKLGGDIRDARRRRRIPVRVLAERALISPTTLTKIERGDPGTAIGFYASVLFVLGLEQRLGELVDVSTDTLGLSLAERDLPERVRWPKRGSGSSEEPDAT
jgi:transcriptional regulator with XRE-family HTH domain